MSVNSDDTISIEFGLPTGSAGMAAGMHGQRIRRWLVEWKDRYNVDVTIHSIQQKKYRSWLIVEFHREEDLTLFALTWTHKTFMPWQRTC